MGDTMRCPNCFHRLKITHDDDVEWVLELHRLSGYCSGNPPPKDGESKARKDKPLDILGDFRY